VHKEATLMNSVSTRCVSVLDAAEMNNHQKSLKLSK